MRTFYFFVLICLPFVIADDYACNYDLNYVSTLDQLSDFLSLCAPVGEDGYISSSLVIEGIAGLTDLSLLDGVPLTRLAVSDCPDLVSLDGLNPGNLYSLALLNLPALASFNTSLSVYSPSVSLEVLGCPALKSFSLVVDGPIDLFVVADCPSLTSFEVSSDLPLTITGTTWMQFSVVDCPSLSSFSYDQPPSPQHQTRSLVLSNLAIASIPQALFGALPGLPSLTILDRLPRLAALDPISPSQYVSAEALVINGTGLKRIGALQCDQLGNVTITNNPFLVSIEDSFSNNSAYMASLNISHNPSLSQISRSFSGCSVDRLTVVGNDALQTLDGFSEMTFGLYAPGQNSVISSNAALQSITGLQGTTFSHLEISHHPLLKDCLNTLCTLVDQYCKQVPTPCVSDGNGQRCSYEYCVGEVFPIIGY